MSRKRVLFENFHNITSDHKAQIERVGSNNLLFILFSTKLLWVFSCLLCGVVSQLPLACFYRCGLDNLLHHIVNAFYKEPVFLLSKHLFYSFQLCKCIKDRSCSQPSSFTISLVNDVFNLTKQTTFSHFFFFHFGVQSWFAGNQVSSAKKWMKKADLVSSP